MKLHEAIDKVLKDQNRPMSARDIAEIINRASLYQRKDGRLIPSSQISARVNNYPLLFRKNENGLIIRENEIKRDVKDVISKIQQKARNLWAHGFIDNRQAELLIPFIFFYKGVATNKINFDWNHKSEISFVGLLNFTKQLNSNHQQFSGKLKDLTSFLENNNTDSKVQQEIDEMLSSPVDDVLDNEFGLLMSGIIASTISLHGRSGLQHATPIQISELVFEIVKNDINARTTIYNPFSGTGTITSLICRNSIQDIVVYGEEFNQSRYLLGLINLLSNKAQIGEYSLTDSLLNDKEKLSDITVFDPPYGGRISDKHIIDQYPVPSTDPIILSIQKAIQSTENGGKIVFVAPEGFLFSHRKDFKKIRELLLEQKLLECIISLPAGILYPYSGVKISLIILSKKQNDRVLYIDAEADKLSTKDGKEIKLNNGIISKIYHQEEKISNMVMEPSSNYGELTHKTVELNSIRENDCDLALRKYFVEDIDIKEKVQLNDLLEIYRSGRIETDEIPFIRISDLNSDLGNVYLDESLLSHDFTSKKGRIIEEDVLLTSSIPPKMKPVFYKKNDAALLLSEGVQAYRVKPNSIIDIEYLIYELKSEYVQNQFNSLGVGVTSQRRVSPKDFLKIWIKWPSLEEQKRIVDSKKEAIYAEKLNEAEKFSGKKEVNIYTEKNPLVFIKHEVGNIIGGISNDINNLKNYVESNDIDLNDKITGRKNAATLNQVFSRMNNNVADIEDLMTNVKGIIDIEANNEKRSSVNFKEYINSEIEKQLTNINNHKVLAIIGIEDDYPPKKDKKIEVLKDQFSVVIRNFIINSIKHGFKDIEQNKVIVFHLSVDEDFYYISLINNGQPFPDNFTLEDFLKFGGREDHTKGNGIGGYLTGKVIQNHNGEINLMEPGTALFFDLPKEEPRFFNSDFIKVGAHFLIKIPKEI